MTQPGVGPISVLAYVLTIGDVSRFRRGKQVESYLGLIPSEKSSSNRRRLRSISKQGNSFLRMLLVESAQAVNRWTTGFVSSTSIAAATWQRESPKWRRRED